MHPPQRGFCLFVCLSLFFCFHFVRKKIAERSLLLSYWLYVKLGDQDIELEGMVPEKVLLFVVCVI